MSIDGRGNTRFIAMVMGVVVVVVDDVASVVAVINDIIIVIITIDVLSPLRPCGRANLHKYANSAARKAACLS